MSLATLFSHPSLGWVGRQRGIRLYVEPGEDEPLNSCGAECATGEDYKRYKDEAEEHRMLRRWNSDHEESDDDDGCESEVEGSSSEADGLVEISVCVEVIRMMIEGKGCPSFVNEVRPLFRPTP